MAYKLNNINDAVDGKFLVVKRFANQADIGTLVHIMGTGKDPSGAIIVDYRITSTGQDYQIKFNSLNDFCKWAKPDQFIARNYAFFERDEILKYIKQQKKTFVTGCLPFLVIALAVIWAVCLILLKGMLRFVVGGIASVAAALILTVFYKKQKSRMMMKMYRKLSSNWGVNF